MFVYMCVFLCMCMFVCVYVRAQELDTIEITAKDWRALRALAVDGRLIEVTPTVVYAELRRHLNGARARARALSHVPTHNTRMRRIAAARGLVTEAGLIEALTAVLSVLAPPATLKAEVHSSCAARASSSARAAKAHRSSQVREWAARLYTAYAPVRGGGGAGAGVRPDELATGVSVLSVCANAPGDAKSLRKLSEAFKCAHARNVSVTRRARTAARRLFDGDGDGVLTTAELSRFMRSLLTTLLLLSEKV